MASFDEDFLIHRGLGEGLEVTIQDAVSLMKKACIHWSLGYDQNNRLDFRDGGETDCSALVIIVCERTGLLPGNNIRKGIGATYTGNMRAAFKARGWDVLGDLPASHLRAGDVLLRDGDHTAMYVGNDQVAMASHDEHGDFVGGAFGNPTGRETVVRSYYDAPWKCVLRFHGQPAPSTPTTKPEPGKLAVDGEIGDESAKKLRAILGLRQGKVIDEGTFKALQAHIGARYRDGIASDQDRSDIDAHWPALKSVTYKKGGDGSPSVKTLQARLGVTQDGKLGKETAKALQRRLNTGRL